jgi:hypothetical protein
MVMLTNVWQRGGWLVFVGVEMRNHNGSAIGYSYLSKDCVAGSLRRDRREWRDANEAQPPHSAVRRQACNAV